MTQEPEQLAVLLHGRHVATLSKDADQRLTLRYERGSERLPILSVSLPPREHAYTHEQCSPFFDGLLPEGVVRERIATRLRKDPTDVFGLLREVGRDCAGAVQVLPVGEEPSEAGDVQWLTENQLSDLLDDLPDRPLGDDPAQGIRISLAGAQEKLVVVREDGRYGLPRGMTPSSHILKPPSRQRRGRRGERLAYPDLVANEAFCMALARAVGFEVAQTEVVAIEDERCLLIARYDRMNADGRTSRVHQEDFCQALGVPTRLKYEQDGGPDVGAFLQLIDRWSVDVATDRDQVIQRVAFNFLIGNADAHAKNYSLLHRTSGIRLAPAYDLLSTAIYGHLAADMATSVRGIFDPGALNAEHFRRWIESLGLSRAHFLPLIARVAEAVLASVEETHAETTYRFGADTPSLARIVEHIRRRATVFAGLR